MTGSPAGQKITDQEGDREKEDAFHPLGRKLLPQRLARTIVRNTYDLFSCRMKEPENIGMSTVEMEIAIREIVMHTPRSKSEWKNWTPRRSRTGKILQ